MVSRSSNRAYLPMENNGGLPKIAPTLVPELQYRNHTPFTARSYRTLPPFTFPPGIDTSEDADTDADTVSMYSEPSSLTTDSADTVLQNTNEEGEDFEASSNDSRTPLPDTALARHRVECLPTTTQAGYFVFPDMFSTGRRISSTPEYIGPSRAAPSNNEEYYIEDKAVLGNVSLGNSPEQDSAISLNKNTSKFLPLLKDEPNYPRNPTLDRELEKVNRRLARATAHTEDQSAQSSMTHPILRIHPASRQAESSADVDTKELAALKAEMKQLKADVKALKRSATLRDSRQAEAVAHFHRNQERLVGGWESTRDELFQIKVMHERLRRSVNMENNIEGRW